VAAAFGEGTATYEASIGSYGSGNGQFSHPAGVALDAKGNLWVVDQGNNRIQKFNEAGEYVSQFGSSGSENGQFSTPKAIAIDAEGNIWVADSGNGRLEQFDDEGEFTRSVGSPGSGNGQFGGPEDIAIDAEGNIWVADTYNYRIQKLDDEGEFIEVVNPEGLGAIEPTGIDVGSGGKVWVTDWAHNRVVALSEAGALVSQFGSGGSGNGEFSRPDGIDVDFKGNVWVGDEGNSRVQKFNEEGEYLDQFGSGGSGEGEFSFSYPFGIVADSGASIWIADSSNDRVQKWSTIPIPHCHAGSASTEEDDPLVLEAGALECEGEAPLTYEIVSAPEHGEISGFNPETGALTYTPDSEFTGLDSFAFKATNGEGSSAVKTFTVAVGEVAVCRDGEDTTVTGEPLVLEAGALECEGEAPLEYEIVSAPEHGEITGFNPETGALTYTPDSEFSGADSFTFRAVNPLGPSPAQSFAITVLEVPLCQNGWANTEENQPLVLESGALECEGEAPLSYEIVSAPEHGEITEFDPETGALTYTPDSEFTGLDSFAFKATNGVGSSVPRTFEVAVGEVAVCHDGEDVTVAGVALVLESGALECEGEAPLSYEIVSAPEHGEITEFDPETGALTYTPNPEFSGADSFTFRAINGLGSSPVQSFAVTVLPVPICHAGSGSTEVDEPLVLEPGALECEGEAPLSYEIVSGPEHGEITGFNPETGALTYTPDSEFTGLDSFTFKAANGVGSSAAKDFNIAVGKLAVCQDGEAATPGEHPLVLEAGALECEGQAPLSYEIVSAPEHGEITEFDPETGALTYTPDSEFSGADSFTFRAVNGLGSSPVQSFAITVQAPPICHAGEAETPVNQPLVLEPGALECEGDAPLSYEIVSAPEHGEISGFNPETGALTYTPDSEFTGLDSFTFKGVNESGSSAAKTFEVEVGEAVGGTPAYQFSIGGFGFGEGEFRHPADVEVDSDGHVFILDSWLYTVQEFTEGGAFIREFGSYGSGNGHLDHPSALAIDGEGNIWIADTGNDRVEEFSPEGAYLAKFGSHGSSAGKFDNPEGIAIDSGGNIYVADTVNRRIQKFTDSGEFLAMVVLTGAFGPEPDVSGLYVEPTPTGIAVGPEGHVWVTDRMTVGLAEFTENLEYIRATSTPKLRRPDTVDVDAHGNVWVGDERNFRVVEFSRKGKYLAQFGTWSGFTGGNFDFSHPFGIDFDAHNHIWITDPGNYRVQRWVEHRGQSVLCEAANATTGVDQPLDLHPGDLDCEGQAPLSYEIVSAPEHGEITEFDPETGALTYTPDSEYNGPDSFGFRVSNELGASPEQTFEIEVGQAPSCEDLKTSTGVNEALGMELNCSGDYAEIGYEIVKGPAHGAITEFDPESGALTYTPDSEFEGTDKFTFQRSSWIHHSRATATIGVCNPPSVEASGEVADPEAPGVGLRVYASPDSWLCPGISSIQVRIDEELVYSENRDCGPGVGCRGRDLIRDIQLPYPKVLGTHDYEVKAEDEVGRKVEDALPGRETDAAGTVLDLRAEAEAEASKEGKCRPPEKIGKLVIGTSCGETIKHRTGATLYRGLGGNDTIYGGGRTDTIRGEDGNDTVYAGRGSDKINAGDDNDMVIGGSGDDLIRGGDGADVLDGGPGADKIKGEGGNDLVRGGATTDRLRGGGGEDTLSYADGVTPGFFLDAATPPLVGNFPAKHGERGVYVNLAEAPFFADNGETARFGGGADKILDNFQDVIGTPFADVIIGSSGPNVIDAGAGTDIVRSGGGGDHVYGGPDADYLAGGGGSDALDGGGGEADTCIGGTATSCPGTTSEAAFPEPSEEPTTTVLVGVLNAHSPHSESSLYVRGSDEADQVSASWGTEKVVFNVNGGKGVLEEGPGCTVESGGLKAECSATEIASLMMDGGAGEDTLEVKGFPKSVTVTLLGGEGADHLIGGESSEDALVDGPGNFEDRLNGKNGDDTLFSNQGKDTLLGGGDADLFVSASLCDGDAIRGGSGDDNANWAQLVGGEIEEVGYPAKPTDPPYNEVLNGVKVRLSNGVVARQEIGCNEPGEQTGSIAAVESLEGSHGPDVLVGNGGNNVLLGRAGADVLRGRGGNDSILANNRNPTPEATPAEKLDLDTRLECGSGPHDVLKLDPADKLHFKPSEFKGCETRPKELVQPGTNYRVPADAEDSERLSNEALDEKVIGAVEEVDAQSPSAFFRFDETSGGSAVDWTNPAAGEEGEEEGESGKESEEEIEEIEAEELEEEEFGFEEEEIADPEPPVGSYQGGVTLGEEGALEESQAIKLDGVDDYVDLTADWDPGSFVFNECGANVSGYSVEMWVKFEAEAGGREELFSRSEGGEGLFLYRSADGRLNFSAIEGIEAPTVSSEQPIDDEDWHQVVAVMAQRGEGCISIASRGAVTEEELNSLESPEMILYVDGFPTTLGVGFERESIIPGWLTADHNIVGASKAPGVGFSNWLAGSIDDFAIYGHALSFDEVEAHLMASDAVQPSAYLQTFPDPNDTDEDGVFDAQDNCPEVANPEQEDADSNGVGDLCEPALDADEDGIVDEVDNCPEDPNPLQEDLDENGVGDVCEAVE
jgi:Ca2+-binding RTX toxin-like protein/streptogramin lyase